MKRPLPTTPSEWLEEIRLAIDDARGVDPGAKRAVRSSADSNLFHLAPLVCLKFRGRKLKGHEAKRVTEVALANYVVNSDPKGINHSLEAKPLLAFALYYVTSHLALDLVDEVRAEAILNYCEEFL